MITDERQTIRELGLRRILKARSGHNKKTTVRRFCVPPLKFDANEYYDLVDWQALDLTEPPVTKNMTDIVLRDMIAAKDTPEVLFPRFPCHTQAVERCIKLVTEASAAVCGVNSRDGFIRSPIESQHEMPKFESKRDYFM